MRLLVNHYDEPAYFRWSLKHRKRLRRFENLHLGESCFIIGNGPSLKDMDLLRIRDCTTFGLNKIYLHPSFQDLQIDYHVAVNPLVIEQSIDEFRKLSCVSFLSFGPCFERKIVDDRFYYVITGYTHRFSFDPYGRISEGSTVTFVALQLAFFMGFKNIFLIGVDHNFEAQGRPHEKQHLEGVDTNHFHPDYFSGQDWHLPDLWGSELSYEMARYFFERDGRQIFDATMNGKLQVYPKVTFEDAVAACMEART